MKIRSNVKAGKLSANHSASLSRMTRGLSVATAVKAGKLSANHSSSMLRKLA